LRSTNLIRFYQLHDIWMLRLAYLADISAKMNELNVSSQSKDNAFSARDRIAATNIKG